MGDIPTVGVVGAGPMGRAVAQACALAGRDVAVAESTYAEYREPQFVPPALLRRMVEAGMHGRRTGRGFHAYPSTAYPIPHEEIA